MGASVEFSGIGASVGFSGMGVCVEFAVAEGGEPVSNDPLVMGVVTRFTPLLSQVPNHSQFRNEEFTIGLNSETGSEAGLRIE